MKKSIAHPVHKSILSHIKHLLFLHWEVKVVSLIITSVLVYFAHSS